MPGGMVSESVGRHGCTTVGCNQPAAQHMPGTALSRATDWEGAGKAPTSGRTGQNRHAERWGDRGNVGIIPSLVRASILPDRDLRVASRELIPSSPSV